MQYIKVKFRNSKHTYTYASHKEVQVGDYVIVGVQDKYTEQAYMEIVEVVETDIPKPDFKCKKILDVVSRETVKLFEEIIK